MLCALIAALWITGKQIFFPEKPQPNPPVAQKPQDKKPVDPKAKPEDEPPPRDPMVEPLPPQVEPAHELITLGSIDPTGASRILATFTTKGAAVERIEVNNPDFRELAEKPEEAYGYLGNLGLEHSPASRCEVLVVGAGTPAAKAGVAAGDVIHHAGKGSEAEVEIKTAHDFFVFLRTTRPGDTVTLKASRSANGMAAEKVFTIELMERPMQVIRPQTIDFTDPWALKPSALKPFSYLLTLEQAGDKAYARDELPAALQGLRDGNWEITKRPTDADPTVEFTRRIDAPRLTSLGGQGALRIVKRYTLAQVPKDLESDRLAPAYHLVFDIEIHNETKRTQKISYQLDGPTGLPEEGWWYAYKVHPTYFSGAGTRDILWSSNHDPKMFITSEIATKSKDAKEPFIPLYGKDQQLDYAGVDAIYFSAIMMPEKKSADNFDPKCEYTFAHTVAGIVGDLCVQRPTRTDITFHLTSSVRELEPEGVFQQRFTIFTGPKVPALLEHYGLENIIVYGWFAWFARGLLFVLHLIHAVIPNWGIAIILLTVVVRLLVYPISRQMALSSQAMQELKPEIDKIKEQYEDNMVKQQEATSALYARHGVNPAAGCLFMPLQMPIFVGLYRGLAIDISLRGASLIPGVPWCENLAGPDMLWYWQPVLEPLGLTFLVGDYGHLGPYLNVLPILTMILFVWQAKQFQQPASNEQEEMMQNVSTFMMVFMGFLFFKVASGLCLYFIVSSLWGIVEKIYVTSGPKEKVVTEPTVDELAETAKDIQAKKDRRKRGKDQKRGERNGDDNATEEPPPDPVKMLLRMFGLGGK